jgi:hypothetical protein
MQNIQTDQSSKLKLIPLLEAYAQAEYDVKQFEEFSGRLAMVRLFNELRMLYATDKRKLRFVT